MDRYDVGVLELGENVHFAIKAGLVGRAGEWALSHDFDGDFPVGGPLDGLVNDTLAAAVELAQDLVARGRFGRMFGRLGRFGALTGRTRLNQIALVRRGASTMRRRRFHTIRR